MDATVKTRRKHSTISLGVASMCVLSAFSESEIAAPIFAPDNQQALQTPALIRSADDRGVNSKNSALLCAGGSVLLSPSRCLVLEVSRQSVNTALPADHSPETNRGLASESNLRALDHLTAQDRLILPGGAGAALARPQNLRNTASEKLFGKGSSRAAFDAGGSPLLARQSNIEAGPYTFGAVMGYHTEYPFKAGRDPDYKSTSFLGGLYGAFRVSRDKDAVYSLNAKAIFVQSNFDFDGRVLGDSKLAAGFNRNSRLMSAGARGDWALGKKFKAALNTSLVYDRWGTDGFTNATGASYTSEDDDAIYARIGGELGFRATQALQPYMLAHYRQELTSPAYSDKRGSVEVGGGIRLFENRNFAASLEATTTLLRESRNKLLLGGNMIFLFGG